MANKITKKDNFNAIIDVLVAGGHNDLADVMRHEIDLISNKSGKKSVKVIEEQTATDAMVRKVITEVGKTATQIYSDMGKPDGVSTPKITASLKRLIANGEVQNYKEGKASLYSLAQ